MKGGTMVDVLVLGGTGRIGRAVAGALAQGGPQVTVAGDGRPHGTSHVDLAGAGR